METIREPAELAFALDATHYNIRLRIIDGTPPQVVVTTFPGSREAPELRAGEGRGPHRPGA
ncbi:hypothetical protein HPP05_06830 [Corallococcus exiguus]|uniref:hypothetical protein n=1 Tax=Corallococcus exiguus TaxID=83462 RepID=UPI001494EE87|nr:hypothetical protein [Corallococcus exiguus]NPC69460.1 hypothetical protein [Corallococcus exiguus]